MFKFSHGLGALALSLFLTFGLFTPANAETTLLNVSYDPTREFYAEFNRLFADHWKKDTGETIQVEQSQGGSGRQARAVIEGWTPMSSPWRSAATSARLPNAAARSRRLARQVPAQFRPLYVDDRLPRPQG
ncbi:TRAP-type C4-dicarboxylate transport system substrate-binding protein [Pseudorhizobium tarimense]|uniref:TRAP-type C4-dicarboxylate transport system substrate-binding protein n=1 Tax=Pseudorhizobium tarimense TaxID=1079109 RepID=A0ABV2H0Q2_9HYPH